MRILVLLLLLTQVATAQKKWTRITGNDFLIYSFMTMSGAADGVNQAIVHHEFGRGRPFWDFHTSWKNKYKNYDAGDERSKFFGSKNIFVAVTDGFHLTRMVDRGFTLTSVAISSFQLKQYKKKDRWKVIAKKAVISTLLNRLAFCVVFNNLEGPF
jgi:hypothetical protein